METKVYWWINGTALGLFVATAFVIITHSPFSGLLAMFFIGLGLTFAKGAKPEKTPNYLFSALSGILWALVYFWMDGALKALGLGPDLSLWIGMFVFSVVTVVVHFIPLKIWINLSNVMQIKGIQNHFAPQRHRFSGAVWKKVFFQTSEHAFQMFFPAQKAEIIQS